MSHIVGVCIRSFKSGIGYLKPRINQVEFSEYVSLLFRSIEGIRKNSHVGNIYVIVNGDPKSTLAESAYPDGTTPTTRILAREFRGSKVVIPVVVTAWGANPGSGVPILEAAKRSKAAGREYLLVLSKEITLSAELFNRAIHVAREKRLDAVGFYRQYWWQRLQWRVPQNTCCLWHLNELLEFRFDPRCDGDGSTIEIGGQAVPIAGMEDFHLLLRIMKAHWTSLRWGMVGGQSPLVWDTSHKNEAERHWHDIKLLRQESVMWQYLQEIFPEETERAMDQFFYSRRIAE